MFFIESERLRLLPLTYTQMLLLKQSRAALEQSLGLNRSNMLIDPFYQAEFDDAMDNFWLPKLRQYPERYMWYTNWEIIHIAQNVSVGGIGIGYPDENGESVTGYSLDQKQQGYGYATEALQRICQWAFTNPEVMCIYADTLPGNLPSQRVLLRAGFTTSGLKDGNPLFKLTKAQADFKSGM